MLEKVASQNVQGIKGDVEDFEMWIVLEGVILEIGDATAVDF